MSLDVQKFGSIMTSRGNVIDTINRKMTVIKSGNIIYIRTPWDDDYDLVQTLMHNVDSVESITDSMGVRFWKQYTIDKDTGYEDTPDASIVVTFNSNTDDNCPIYFNASFLGGNHGYLAILVSVATSHGKAIEDEGSKWQDGVGVEYTILRVVDENTLWLISENTTVSPPAWLTKAISNPTTFSHVSGATATADFSVTTTSGGQWYPALQNKDTRFLIDGKEFEEDGVYQGDNFDLINAYEIKDPFSILTYCQTQTGSAEHISFSDSSITSCAKIQNIYHYTPNGGCALMRSFTPVYNVSFVFDGAVQAGLLPSQGGNIYMYIQGLDSYVEGAITYDWSAIQEITDSSDVTNHYIGSANLTDALKPSKVYLQYTTNSDGDKVFGFCLGYNPSVGQTQDSIRKDVLNSIANILTTRKSYPYSINYSSAQTRNADDNFDVVAFRCPVNYSKNPDATNVSWHEVGKDVYLYIDYHQAFTGYVKLEDYLINKKVELIDSSGCTVDSDIILSDGLHITIAGSYGHAIIKLT